MSVTPYIQELSTLAKNNPSRLEEIIKSIAEKGFWMASEEWRISTVTQMRIEPIEIYGGKYYKVSVKCDSEHVCYCPTIERAAEFLGVFEQFIMDLLWTLGWPS